MRLRLFFRSLARAVKNSLSFLVIALLLAGCSSSTAPSYVTGNVAQALEDTCKKEFDLDLKVKVVGSTLWVYLSAEDVLREAKKPKKILKLFEIKENKHEFVQDIIKSEYSVDPIPEKEEFNPYEYDEKVSEANDRILRTLFRILSSAKESPRSPIHFTCLVTADIKNGFFIRQTIYNTDMKKAFYGLLSPAEFHHRIPQETQANAEIINDKEGKFIDYHDITWQEFITEQIKNRIQLKFEKPEVKNDADIDKEIVKIVANTIKIYEFEDFSTVELYNALTQKKFFFNRRALLEGIIEQGS